MKIGIIITCPLFISVEYIVIFALHVHNVTVTIQSDGVNTIQSHDGISIQSSFLTFIRPMTIL